jgi:hypothetical protein
LGTALLGIALEEAAGTDVDLERAEVLGQLAANRLDSLRRTLEGSKGPGPLGRRKL